MDLDPHVAPQSPGVALTIHPARLTSRLFAVVLSISLLSAAAHILRLAGGRELHGLVWRFDVGTDSSIPTWYASATLLLCSAVLLLIGIAKARGGDRFALHWKGLALLFAALSVDEVAMLHEWTGMLHTGVPAEGFFYYSWVIFGWALVGSLAVLYLRFLLHLPAGTHRLFLAAGVIFLGGALGVEMVNASYAYHIGTDDLTYVAMTAVEGSATISV